MDLVEQRMAVIEIKLGTMNAHRERRYARDLDLGSLHLKERKISIGSALLNILLMEDHKYSP